MPLPEIIHIIVPADSVEPHVVGSLRFRYWVKLPDGEELVAVTTNVSPEGKAMAPDGLDAAAVTERLELLDTQARILETIVGERLDEEEIRIELHKGIVEALVRPEPTAAPMLQRNGRFEILGSPDASFSGFQLSVSPVVDADMRAVFTAFSDETEPPRAWVEETQDLGPSLNRLALAPVNLGFDGRFQFRLPLTGDETGWVYVLSGPRTFVGFRTDDVNRLLAHEIVILLPGVAGSVPGTSGNGGATVPVGDTGIPVDATEGQLLDNAELFSDDPGPFCRPFSNPERVLGERRFQTVLRVETPEIAKSGGLKIKDLPPRLVGSGNLAFDNVRMIRMISDAADAGNDSVPLPELEDLTSVSRGPLANVRRNGILDFIRPDILKKKVRRGRRAVGPDNLIDWEGDSSENQAVSVAGGHVLEWRVRWRSNGYSLGSVSHTLTLAPRQIKRIMKIDFARREKARREEESLIDDEVSQTTERERDYSDAVSASLSEWSRGESSASTTAAAGGIGLAFPGVVIGGGAAHGSANSSSSQSGERRSAANEEQNLRDAIRQHGESLRKMDSTVITEIEQEESVEGVSEVITNPNYCHALTVVYYDILRHLRVDTELGGVSECLFVPFTITPFAKADANDPSRFDVTRLIRHSESLRRYLRDRRLRWVFPYLEDYSEDFVESEVPEGKRMEQELVFLRGTIDIRITVESPLKGDEDARALEELADSDADDREKNAKTAKWIGIALTPFSPILGIGVAAASAKLAKRAAEEREALFEREIAGHMARRFVDRLEMFVGDSSQRISADFALQGGYRKGGVHRVHFQVPVSQLQGVTREMAQNITIKAPSQDEYRLPPFSVANVLGGRISFATDTYRRTSSDSGLVDDLLVTSNADQERASIGTAHLSFPASAWEKRDLRESIKRDVEKLVLHMDSHRHFYHKVIWWRMDRDELFTILDGYTISGSDSRSIASVVERTPLGMAGNSIVFRVARGAFVGAGGYKSLDDAFERYRDKERVSDPMRISLPTGGVYAQALMDECGACEEHFGSTDWVLDRGDILPQELDASLLGSRRTAPQDLTPTQFPETLINLQNAPAAPAPSGLADAFNSVGNANAFRDMAGLSGTQANARAAMETAAGLATSFGGMALSSQLAQLKADATAGKDLQAFAAAAKQASDKGMMAADKAKAATEEFAKRKAGEAAEERAKATNKNAQEVLKGDGGGTAINVDKDGATIVQKEPVKPRPPDPDAGFSVVPIPPNQVLFMNFKTDDDTLRPDHVKALEILVGAVGLQLNDVVEIEGHTSTSGSDEHNENLGLERSTRLFEKMHALVQPLNPNPNFSPIYVTTVGEKGSYRTRFSGIPKIANAPGAGHRNDPVEKAVLFTFDSSIDVTSDPRVVNFFGVSITISGNLVFIENRIIVSLPDGTVKLVDRSTNTVINQNITDQSVSTTTGDTINTSVGDTTTTTTGDTTISGDTTTTGDTTATTTGDTTTTTTTSGDTHQDFSVKKSADGNITINAAEGSTVKLIVGDHGKIEDHQVQSGGGSTPAVAHNNWLLQFHGPKLEGARTLGSILDDIAAAVIGIDFTPDPDATSPQFASLVENSAGQPQNLAFGTLLDVLGLSQFGNIMNTVRFGTVTFGADIKAQSDPSDKISGHFTGVGVMIGSTASVPSAIILNNAPYTTAEKLKAADWDDQTTRFVEFGYVNNGFVQSAQALKDGIVTLTDLLLPFLPGVVLDNVVVHGMDTAIDMLTRLGAGSGVRFKALPADPLLKMTGNAAGATGAEIQLVATARNALAFFD